MRANPLNKRKICNACQYPETRCVCKWVVPCHSPVELVILQHPKEVKHAKNTVKLLKLSLTNLRIVVGENATDFATLSNQICAQPDQYALCYPSKTSFAIESIDHNASTQPKGLIFIDASWRKALKIWHLNPWLHNLTTWHFAHPPANQYQIRHTTQKNSLSTLESVAYVLELTQGTDCSALKNLFNKMQQTSFLNY